MLCDNNVNLSSKVALIAMQLNIKAIKISLTVQGFEVSFAGVDELPRCGVEFLFQTLQKKLMT